MFSEETAIEQLTATLTSDMKMATMIEFSEALTDPSSEEYKLAAENIRGVFGAEMENMAEVMGAILERMEVLFEEGSSFRRRRRGSSTEAVITSVFSVTISESTDLTQLENDVISSSTSAANAAIASSGGAFISADAVITVSVGIETAEGMYYEDPTVTSMTVASLRIRSLRLSQWEIWRSHHIGV